MSPSAPKKHKKAQPKRLQKKLAKGHPPTTTETSLAPLVDLASESWRLARVFEGALEGLPRSEKLMGQVRYFRGRMDQILATANLSAVSVEGEMFDIGMPFRALNLDEFALEDRVIVDRVIEPAIVSPDGVKRAGTLLLKKEDA